MGSIVTAVGLQFFILPNHLLDGGITGISIIVAKLTDIPLGWCLAVLNIPFIILGYNKVSKAFALYSSLGIALLAVLTSFHVSHGFTDVPILAAVFGGVVIGIGVGIVARFGGIIDGADTIAVLIDRVTVFSIGEAIMVINSVIITLSGFVFGWEQALYSLIAYFVVHKTVDVTVEGLNESRSAWIVSMHVRAIGKEINEIIKEPVTYVKESDSTAREPHGVMIAVITRFEEQKIIKAVRAIDPMAYLVISSAHEVGGKVSEGTLNIER